MRPERVSGWDLLLLCVAVYLADAVGRLQSLFPLLRFVKPSFVCASGAIALYVMQQRGLRRVAALRNRTTTAVVLLLLWGVLSVPAALNRGVAFLFVTEIFVKAIILYALVAGAVRTLQDVERLALVYFAAAVLYSALVLQRFDLSDGNWRLADLYTYDANDFATFAVTAIPLGLYFAARGRRSLTRLASLVGVVILVMAFVRSGSRGGFLAIAGVGLYVLLGYTTVPARWRVAGTAVIVAVVLATAGPRYWTQMRTIVTPSEDYNRTAENGRIQIWRRGMGYMFAHPLLGVGAYNFEVAEGTISPLAQLHEYNIAVPWTAAHNSFVQVGAELGIPGLLFFLIAIGGGFVMLRRVTRIKPPGPRPARPPAHALAQAVTGSLIGFVVGGFFLSLAYHEMLYALLGLATGLGKVTLGQQRPAGGAWAHPGGLPLGAPGRGPLGGVPSPRLPGATRWR